MSMLRHQQAGIADALHRTFTAAPNPATAITGCLAVALDLLGDIPAAPYRVGDVILGMLTEVAGTPHQRDRGEPIPAEILDDAVTDFAALLDRLASSGVVGAAD